jgi:hypothetical protein
MPSALTQVRGTSESQPAAPALPVQAPQQNLSIPKVRFAEIVNCVDADGKKHRRCGELSLDAKLVEPLRSLSACAAAQGVSGVLSLGFDVDFGNSEFGGLTVGKSTTLESSVAQDLLKCAKTVLAKVNLAGVEHAFNRYRVFYKVEFSDSTPADSTPADSTPSAAASAAAANSPTGSASASDGASSGEVQGASGRATVTWEVALVRKSPKDGAIIARVLGGTRLVVTGRQGDWYRVKYDAQGNEGFVFKSAIGL